VTKEALELPAAQVQRLERLGRELEEAAGAPREAWPVPTLRSLADAILPMRDHRRKGPEHEARFLNLLGFCLRPGFGATLDEYRVSEAWKLYLQGLAYPKRDACRLEWLVLWRRISGGLGRGQQEEIFSSIAPHVRGDPKAVPRQELAELWRAAASFEHLPVKRKLELGDIFLKHLEQRRAPPRWGPWAIGRVGAREPLYGPLDRLVPADRAAAWLERLLKLDARGEEELPFALIQLARLTGDRTRDVPDDLRSRARTRLLELGLDARAVRPLEDVVHTEKRTEGAWYGDSVPVGLTLASS
jgi:hypothetical protein